MTAEDLRWIIGVAVSAVLAVSAMLTAAFRSLAVRIDVLHSRLNKVKEDYVRRDDLDKHLERIDGNVNELRREIRDSQQDRNERLDEILKLLTAGDENHGKTR